MSSKGRSTATKFSIECHIHRNSLYSVEILITDSSKAVFPLSFSAACLGVGVRDFSPDVCIDGFELV